MKNGFIRTVSFTAALLFLAGAAEAEVRLWTPTNGIKVRQGLHIEWFRSAARDADGNFALVWSDTRSGDRDLWMQLVDSDGAMLWPADGVLVASEVSRQEDPHVMPDGAGNWYVTWVDYRDDIDIEDKGDIYIQKIDSDGVKLWTPETGVALCTNSEKQLWVQSFPDGAGGVVSIWVDDRTGQSDIYAQRTDADGNPLWAQDGVLVAGGLGDQGDIGSGKYTADSDGAGGILVAWVDNRNPSDINLYGQHIDVNGQLLWASGDSTGLPICTAAGEQKRVRLAPDGYGGAFVVWEDRRLDINNGDIYGQHLDADGNALWTADGVILCDAFGAQEKVRIVNSAPGEAILVWEDRRVDNVSIDLYTQRISGTDAPVLHWGPAGSEVEGIVLCDAIRDQTAPRLTPDGEGGAVFTWLDERDSEQPNQDLYAQRLDSSGAHLWGDANGIPVSDRPGGQEGNIVRVLNSNRVAVAWFDFRQGSPGLFYQVFDGAGDDLLAEDGVEVIYGIDNNGGKPHLIPSSDNSLFFVWVDSRYGAFGTYIYAQKVDALTGDLAWDENGISITPGFPYGTEDTLSVLFKSVKLASDGLGGLLAAWQDNREVFVPLIYAQRIDADGTPLWGDRGVVVASDPSGLSFEQDEPEIAPTGDGGMVVAFEQANDDYYQNVKIQKLGTDGEALWGAPDDPGVWVTDAQVDHELETLSLFDDGSVLVVYSHDDETPGHGNEENLYAQRYDADGVALWDPPLPLCEAFGTQLNVAALPLGGGVLLAWEDQRRSAPILDIYGQVVYPDGTVEWDADGRQLIEADNQQSDIVLGATGPDADSFWMVWKDRRDGETADIYVQRFDTDGTPQFTPDDGILVGTDDVPQETPRLLVEWRNGAYIAWEEIRGELFSDLYITHLTEAGTLATDDYTGGGAILCNAYHRQINVELAPDFDGGVVSAWEDLRSTGKEPLSNIYAQRVNDFTADAPERTPATPTGYALEGNYPNPFNPATTIRFSVERREVVKLAVYDVLGRRVATLFNGKAAPGSHSVQWNGRDDLGRPVASGTYFYRLEIEGERQARRMILLK